MPTRLDYCQYLLSMQTNFTITNYANHVLKFSHDAINRYLIKEKMTAVIAAIQSLENTLKNQRDRSVLKNSFPAILGKNSIFPSTSDLSLIHI